jgi:hypothetical protein
VPSRCFFFSFRLAVVAATIVASHPDTPCMSNHTHAPHVVVHWSVLCTSAPLLQDAHTTPLFRFPPSPLSLPPRSRRDPGVVHLFFWNRYGGVSPVWGCPWRVWGLGGGQGTAQCDLGARDPEWKPGGVRVLPVQCGRRRAGPLRLGRLASVGGSY